MTLLLLAKDETTVEQVRQDSKQIQKAIDAIKRAKARGVEGQPMVLTLIGYEVYAIPGTIEAVETIEDIESGKTVVKLDLQYAIDMSAEGV